MVGVLRNRLCEEGMGSEVQEKRGASQEKSRDGQGSSKRKGGVVPSFIDFVDDCERSSVDVGSSFVRSLSRPEYAGGGHTPYSGTEFVRCSWTSSTKMDGITGLTWTKMDLQARRAWMICYARHPLIVGHNRCAYGCRL